MMTTPTQTADAALTPAQLPAEVDQFLEQAQTFQAWSHKETAEARLAQKVEQLRHTLTTSDGFSFADTTKLEDYHLQLVRQENETAQELAQDLLKRRHLLQQQLKAAITEQEELVDEVTAQARQLGAKGLSNTDRLLAQLLATTQMQQAQAHVARLSFPQLLEVYRQTPDHANRELVREVERQHKLGFPDVSIRKAKPDANARAAQELASLIRQRRQARVDQHLLQAQERLQARSVTQDTLLQMLANRQITVADHVQRVVLRAK